LLKAKAKAKDLTLKAKTKDSKFVLEDTTKPRTKPRTTTLDFCFSVSKISTCLSLTFKGLPISDHLVTFRGDRLRELEYITLQSPERKK